MSGIIEENKFWLRKTRENICISLETKLFGNKTIKQAHF